MLRYYWRLIIILLCLADTAWAACSWDGNTGTVASPYAIGDFEDCVTGASALTGEVTIVIPSDTTWTDDYATVDMSSGFTNVTSLTISGTGTLPTTCASASDEGLSTPTACGSSGSVTITLSNASLYIVGAAAKKWRVTNLGFTGSTHERWPGAYWAAIEISGQTLVSAGGGGRIDYITFAAITNGRCIKGEGNQNAVVIDHIDSGVTGQFSDWLISTTGGNYQWAQAVSQQDIVWIEDSYLEDTDVSGGYPGMAMDNNNGYSVGFRHNTVKNYYLGGHDCSSVERSGRFYALYNNINITTLSGSSSLYNLRGGEHYVYGNRIIGTQASPFGADYGNGISVQNYRTGTGMGSVDPWDSYCDNTAEKACLGVAPNSTSPKSCTSDADCGGESGSCVNIDTNSAGNGWPCRDQIGVGEDQARTPSLFWANTLETNGGEASAISPYVRSGSGTVIQANRDYCTHATTMPATCDSISTVYTEYAYPHPLRGESAAAQGKFLPANFGAGRIVATPKSSGSGLGVTVY